MGFPIRSTEFSSALVSGIFILILSKAFMSYDISYKIVVGNAFDNININIPETSLDENSVDRHGKCILMRSCCAEFCGMLNAEC